MDTTIALHFPETTLSRETTPDYTTHKPPATHTTTTTTCPSSPNSLTGCNTPLTTCTPVHTHAHTHAHTHVHDVHDAHTHAHDEQSKQNEKTRLNFANFQPIETKVCAICKRNRTMSKFSDYQFSKEFGDCLDCIYIHGKHRREDTRVRRNTIEFRLSALHASPRKERSNQDGVTNGTCTNGTCNATVTPRERRKHSVAFDRIVINTLEEGVKLFCELDTDCNGTISKAELIRGLSTHEKLRECLMKSKLSKGHFQVDPYTKLFKNIDADGNGTIDLEEFITMLKTAHYDIYKEEEKFLQQQKEEATLLPVVVEIPTIFVDDKVDLLSPKEKQAARTLNKLSSMEIATKPSADAVKRSQFKSPHRQYVEKKQQKALRSDKKDVMGLSGWSTYNPSVESMQDPFSAESSPRGRGEGKLKQMYTYQTTDGCLIMHERKSEVCMASPRSFTETNIDSVSDEPIISPRNLQEIKTPRWQEITSVDLSDVKKRDPHNFSLLSGDCSQRKKILCWKVEDDTSSSDDDDEE